MVVREIIDAQQWNCSHCYELSSEMFHSTHTNGPSPQLSFACRRNGGRAVPRLLEMYLHIHTRTGACKHVFSSMLLRITHTDTDIQKVLALNERET